MSQTPESNATTLAAAEPKLKSPYIFLSHDTRDAELAEAFAKLLSSVTAGVLKCFRSSDKRGVQGIEYGVEWFPELMKRLQEASDVVCLLTENSVNRPWILFEAGVAKGKLDTPILGLALGVPLSTVNTGPFAQFQNSDDEEDSLVKLTMQLVRKIPGAEPDEAVVRMQVQTFKGRCAESLKKAPAKPKEVKKEIGESQTIAKLFEEIKVMFNDLPARLEIAAPSPRRRRPRRLPSEVFEEIQFMTKRAGPDVALLMILASLREELPLIYELGRELVTAVRTQSEDEIKGLLYSFHEMVEMSARHPFFREFVSEHPSNEHILQLLHRLAEDVVMAPRKRKT